MEDASGSGSTSSLLAQFSSSPLPSSGSAFPVAVKAFTGVPRMLAVFWKKVHAFWICLLGVYHSRPGSAETMYSARNPIAIRRTKEPKRTNDLAPCADRSTKHKRRIE
jgi:hypothetical protein